MGKKRSTISKASNPGAAKSAVVYARSEREKLFLDHKKRDLRVIALKLRTEDNNDTVSRDHLFDELRSLAFSTHGFVSDELRQLIWPLVLGESSFAPVRSADSAHFARINAPHRDDQQIQKDIDRSMWHYDVVTGIRESERRVKRKQLTQVINAVLNDNKDLYYYQGYHDVCTVFLLVLGDQLAFRAIRAVSSSYHREPMRKNFENALHATRLLYPLIEDEDPELFAHMKASGVEPFFAMPWMITWFAHQLSRFADVARVYDVLLVSHPLFVLYLSAAVVLEARHRVLKAECDFGTLHGLLAKLPQTMELERVIARANIIFHRHPPDELLPHSEHAEELRATTFFTFPFAFHAGFPTIGKPFLPPTMYKKHNLVEASKSSTWLPSVLIKAAIVSIVAVSVSYAFRHHLRQWVPLLTADPDQTG